MLGVNPTHGIVPGLLVPLFFEISTCYATDKINVSLFPNGIERLEYERVSI